MSTLLILNNRDSFTHNLKHLFLSVGAETVNVMNTIDFNTDSLDNVGGLVLSPGPGLPKDHPQLKEAINRAWGQIPIFGVCLGHQAIIEFCGGTLKNLQKVYHGIRSVLQVEDNNGLWIGVDPLEPVGRYHSWVADESSFPDCLAISSLDEVGNIMSFYHKSLPIFGVQFHPESFMTNQGRSIARNFMRTLDE